MKHIQRTYDRNIWVIVCLHISCPKILNKIRLNLLEEVYQLLSENIMLLYSEYNTYFTNY
jgi:hypothetical protein